MDRLFRILLLSALESCAAILMQRGIYFFAYKHLEFSATDNLLLALLAGVTYILGAVPRHRLCVRYGERRVLAFTAIGLLATCSLMAIAPRSAVVIVVCNGLVSWMYGMKWPIIESYVTAGRNPREVARALGWFNITWAGTVPVCVAAAGAIIVFNDSGLFVISIVINASILAIMAGLPRRPTHLSHDHPERLPADHAARYTALLKSSRWLMTSSYMLVFVLVPLLPEIFIERLGFGIVAATALSSIMDATRWLTFVVMERSHKWHGSAAVIAWSLILMPATFFMILIGNSLAVVLIGELFFGLAEGVVYYAALYYAMVIKNSSVDAGGAHEAMIGVGFTLGPLAGLAGKAMAGAVGGATIGMIAGVSPVIVLCTVGGLLPLLALRPRRTPAA